MGKDSIDATIEEALSANPKKLNNEDAYEFYDNDEKFSNNSIGSSHPSPFQRQLYQRIISTMVWITHYVEEFESYSDDIINVSDINYATSNSLGVLL